MIKVRISCTGDDIRSIDVSGHALFDQYGKDVVCAGVSSVVIGALNALDILYPSACDLDISGNQIHIHVLKIASLSNDAFNDVLSIENIGRIVS